MTIQHERGNSFRTEMDSCAGNTETGNRYFSLDAIQGSINEIPFRIHKHTQNDKKMLLLLSAEKKIFISREKSKTKIKKKFFLLQGI